MTEPIIPAAYTILWLLIPLAYVGLLAAAVFIVVKAKFLSPTERVVWTIVSVVIPILGPLAWLASYSADPRRRKNNPNPGRT